jgi:serine/threonine-protein kinase
VSEPGAKAEVFARASLRVGQVVKGKYRLDRVIGVGGMAVVYAATHRNQKRVAVKMLHVELSHVGDVRARFLREGYVANTVNHPGALAVLDEDVADDGAAFLVMELLEGQPLDTLADARGNRLSEAIALSVGEQLLDVLSAAHAKTIIHRDIKPANLFITRDGTLKVLDFGIARLRDAALHDATSTGVVLGTPAFMSPEQAYGRNDEIDAQSDVFATGATLFKILAGRSVHGGGTSSEILIRAATSPAPPLASLRPDIDPRVASLVDRALAVDKAARWATAAAMRDAIRELGQASAGKQGLAELVDEIGVTSTRPVSPHADTAALPSTASAFAAPDAQPRPQAPQAEPEPDPTRAAPLQHAGTTGATGATAAPITRNAQNAPTVVRPAAPVVRSALFGVSMAFGLAALILVPLVATGRYHLRAPAQPVASETLFVAPPPPSAPVPSAAASSEPSVPATPSASASGPGEEARPQTPPSPASAVAPLAPKPKVAAPAPGDTPRPAPPKHGTKPNDDDLFHP